jgi:hypothetical protein
MEEANIRTPIVVLIEIKHAVSQVGSADSLPSAMSTSVPLVCGDFMPQHSAGCWRLSLVSERRF